MSHLCFSLDVPDRLLTATALIRVQLATNAWDLMSMLIHKPEGFCSPLSETASLNVAQKKAEPNSSHSSHLRSSCRLQATLHVDRSCDRPVACRPLFMFIAVARIERQRKLLAEKRLFAQASPYSLHNTWHLTFGKCSAHHRSSACAKATAFAAADDRICGRRI